MTVVDLTGPEPGVRGPVGQLAVTDPEPAEPELADPEPAVPGEAAEPTPVRQQRATALGRNTHGVPDLRRLVEDQFHRGFPHRVWVAGQVGQTTVDAEGGLRFRLHASSGDEPFWLPCVVPVTTLPALDELLGRLHDADVVDLVEPGRLLRAGGLVRFDAIRGGVVLTVSELDPQVTARGLAQDRAQAMAAARASGLPGRQRGRTPRTAPLSVTVVRGPDDPAAARVRARLTGSGYDLRVRDLPTPLRGAAAEPALAQAVREAALVSDLVLLVREQGRPLGLAVFDSEQVARAVAEAPVPVLTGLGGGGEPTVCDEVAYAALATADDAGEWVLDRLEAARTALVALREEVAGAAEAAAQRARSDLAEGRAAVHSALEQAAPRAQARRRLRWRVTLAVAAVLAVALVVAAVVLGRPVLLVGLAVPVVAVLTLRWWDGHVRTRGRRVMQTDDDFAQVLTRLAQVRDELAATSSPEAVRRLRDSAEQLVERGERLLHSTVGPA